MCDPLRCSAAVIDRRPNVRRHLGPSTCAPKHRCTGFANRSLRPSQRIPIAWFALGCGSRRQRYFADSARRSTTVFPWSGRRLRSGLRSMLPVLHRERSHRRRDPKHSACKHHHVTWRHLASRGTHGQHPLLCKMPRVSKRATRAQRDPSQRHSPSSKFPKTCPVAVDKLAAS